MKPIMWHMLAYDVCYICYSITGIISDSVALILLICCNSSIFVQVCEGNSMCDNSFTHQVFLKNLNKDRGIVSSNLIIFKEI